MVNEPKKSLLEIAQNVKTHKRVRAFTQDEIDLCLAWMADDISFTAVMTALKQGSCGSYTFLALCARHIFNERQT